MRFLVAIGGLILLLVASGTMFSGAVPLGLDFKMFGAGPSSDIRPEDFVVSTRHPQAEAEAEAEKRHRQMPQVPLTALMPKIGPAPANCALPAAATDDVVVMFGVYEGGGVSSVALSGRNETTTAGRVVIERGRGGLYLILSTRKPIVWVLEGATDRVTRVVLLSQNIDGHSSNVAAVTGVARDKVTFVTPGSCFSQFDKATDPPATNALHAVTAALGRLPDTLAGAYEIAGVYLPSAKALRAESATVRPPSNFDPLEWREALQKAPAGLFTMDVNAVVAARKAELYDVLPDAFGTTQLSGNGSILPTAGYYLVRKPIPRLPAGFRSSLPFALDDGILMPSGAEASCVISKKTRRPIAGCADR